MSVISSLQTTLQDFAEFNFSKKYLFEIFFNFVNEVKKIEQIQQKKIIVFFFESAFKLNDLNDQNVYSIQLTAEFCSNHIVKKFISANADINAIKNDDNALFAAVGRELFAIFIVRRILIADAIISKKIEKQNEFLEKILRYFHDADNCDDQFLFASSLEYVFNEKSEAMLFDFFHLMSQIIITDIK